MLVVFEGMDGAGKSTVIRLVHDKLIRLGHQVSILRQPTHGPYGKKFRRLSNSAMDHAHANSILIKDRGWDVYHNIIPNIRAGLIVLMDRYYLSHVYQADSIKDAQSIIALNRKRFPKPEFTVVFDVSPFEAKRRIQKSRGRVHNLEMRMPTIRNLYKSVLSFENTKKLNGHKPARINAEYITDRILRRLDRKAEPWPQ